MQVLETGKLEEAEVSQPLIEQQTRKNIYQWAVENKETLVAEAGRRGITPQDLIVIMLDDALDAYTHAEVV